MITIEEFRKMTPYQKGYIVYMCGNVEEEPNVPVTYKPAEKERKKYNDGAFAAMLSVQESS